MTTIGQKALDRWAREAGYSDFDTFVRTGGSLAEAARNISRRISALRLALDVITGKTPLEADEPPSEPDYTAIAPETLAQVQAEHDDEPADPKNAHAQGGEFAN